MDFILSLVRGKPYYMRVLFTEDLTKKMRKLWQEGLLNGLEIGEKLGVLMNYRIARIATQEGRAKKYTESDDCAFVVCFV
ncbi:hypothetical protein GBO32_06125 [Roseivirga pacifica]|nr:hypothetical protein [Roseivirga pacifica]